MCAPLIIGAQICSFFIAASALTDPATAYISSLNRLAPALMALIPVGYLLLATIMKAYAVVIITVPIITPLILNMGRTSSGGASSCCALSRPAYSSSVWA